MASAEAFKTQVKTGRRTGRRHSCNIVRSTVQHQKCLPYTQPIEEYQLSKTSCPPGALRMFHYPYPAILAPRYHPWKLNGSHSDVASNICWLRVQVILYFKQLDGTPSFGRNYLIHLVLATLYLVLVRFSESRRQKFKGCNVSIGCKLDLVIWPNIQFCPLTPLAPFLKPQAQVK